MNLVARKKSAACGMGTLFFGERACCCKRPRATVGPSGGLEGYAMWPNGTPKVGMGDDAGIYQGYSGATPVLGPDLSPIDLSTMPYDPTGTESGLNTTEGASEIGAVQNAIYTSATEQPTYVFGPSGSLAKITPGAAPGSATITPINSLLNSIANLFGKGVTPSHPVSSPGVATPQGSTNPTVTAALPWLLGGGALILLAAVGGRR